MFLREGLPVILGVTALAVVMFGAALRFRSWPLWLTGFVTTVVAILVAWSFRAPARL